MAASLRTLVVSWNDDTLEYLLRSGRNGVAHHDELEVLLLQRRVFVAELAGGDDLTGT